MGRTGAAPPPLGSGRRTPARARAARSSAASLLLAALLAAPALAQGPCSPGAGANMCTPRLLPAPGVGGGAGTALDPYLLSCDPERTAANMRAHVATLAGDMRRAAVFYGALAEDLAAVERGAGEWCGACRQAAAAFATLGYASCGGWLSAAPSPEELAASDRFGPGLCEEAVEAVCAPDDPSSAWCTASSLPSPQAESCPLCLTLDCVYGDECRLGAPNPAGRNATGRPSCPLAGGAAGPAACAADGRVFPGPGDGGGGFGLDLRICVDLDIGLDISGCAVIGDGGVSIEGEVGVGGEGGGGGGVSVEVGASAGGAARAEGAGGEGGGAGAAAGAAGPGEGAQAGQGGKEGAGEAGRADARSPWDAEVNASVPPDQCLPPGDLTACNAGGVPGALDARPRAIGSPSDDLGLSGCVTEGSPPLCQASREAGGREAGGEAAVAPAPPSAGAGGGAGSPDCSRCARTVVWHMDMASGGPDCLACATRCRVGGAGGSAAGDAAFCLLCSGACRWSSETVMVGSGGTDCSGCAPSEPGGAAWTSPIRTVGNGWVVECADCERWCSEGFTLASGIGTWGLDCAACASWCRGGAPVGAPERGGTPGRMEAPIGSCAEGRCCGPPFTCQDAFVDYAHNATGCLDEERPCASVTQASLVTRRKRNAIPSPGGVRECQQNAADLKDVCTVDGSSALGGPTLDPCALADRLRRLAARVRDVASRLGEAADVLERLASRLEAEHARGTADRSAATAEASARAVAAALAGAETGPGLQEELAAMVGLLRSDEFRRDISGAERLAVSDFGIEAVAPGEAGAPAPRELCVPGVAGGTVCAGGGEEVRSWKGYCSAYERCGPCSGESGPAGCLGPTSSGSYLSSALDLRGRCGSTGAVPAVIEERGLDAWRERGGVDALLAVDPDRDLFIDTEACYRYGVARAAAGAGSSPLECTAACRACDGVDRSHCHGSLGVCVCEAGPWWRLTSQPCWPSSPASARELACCERLFGALAEPARLRAGPACTGPSVSGVAVDWCRSWPGLCCVYGFEEVPVERACEAAGADAARSCVGMCAALFDGRTAERCARRCAGLWPSCDEGCLSSGDAECLAACAPQAAPCIASCVAARPESAAACELACSAALPEAEVRPFVTRALSPRAHAQVFASGDRVEVGGSLNNTGAVPLEGTARLSLVALDRCACEGERCSCREERLALGERAVAMGPGDWLDLEAAATTLGRANASVQALVEVADARGAVVASGRSPISHVVDAGPLAVRDAYFLGPGGRTTEAYPGAAVTASAVLDSAVAPAAVSLSLVKAGEGVPGSAAFYRLDRTGTTLPLSTGRYTAAEGDVGQVVSVHVKALGPNGTVLLDRTLVQQGIVPGTCQEAMTRRCLDQLGARGPSFPSTFVQVRRLALSVASSAFMDEGGREVGSVEGGADLSAAAVVRNGMAVPFEGVVEATVVSEGGGAAAASKASLTGARSLEPGDKALVLVDRFRATAPGTYGLRLRASDAGGRVWLDETASARLEARPAAARPSPTPGPAPAPSPGPGQAPGPSAAPPAGAPPPIASLGSIDTTIGVEGCRFTVRCEGCSSGCKLVLDAERCTLATRDCGCMCGSAPGRGAGGAGAQQA